MFSRHELDPQSGYWNVYSNLEKSYKYAYGSMAKAEQQFSWKPAPASTMTTGATFERFFAIPQGADLNAPVQSQDAPGTILDTNIPDDFVKLHYANTGAFAQMQYAMTPRVTLTLGARGDYNTRFGGTFNPRLGLVARPTESTTLKLLYGTAFLAPSPYQAYAHYGSFYSTDGGKTYASELLASAESRPQAAAEEDRRGQRAAVARRTTSSSPARRSTRASRISSRRPTPIRATPASITGGRSTTSTSPVNEGHATIYGGIARRSTTCGRSARIGASRRTPRRRSSTAVSGSRTRPSACRSARCRRSSSASAPTSTGIAGASRRDSRSSARNGCWRRRGATDRSTRRTLDGYATVDVNVRRSLFKGLDAFVTVENAFDRRYRTINIRAYTNPEELIGAPQNPRRVSVGFSLRIR